MKLVQNKKNIERIESDSLDAIENSLNHLMEKDQYLKNEILKQQLVLEDKQNYLRSFEQQIQDASNQIIELESKIGLEKEELASLNQEKKDFVKSKKEFEDNMQRRAL